VRAAVLLVSDQPERFMALRRSVLAGRSVHLWLPEGNGAADWSAAVRGEPTDAATFSALADRDVIVVVDLLDEEMAKRVAHAASRGLPSAPVLLIDRQRGGRRSRLPRGVLWIDEGELLADAIEHVLGRAATGRRVQSLRRALRGAERCAFLIQHDPDPDAIASALALRSTLGFRPKKSPIVTLGQITRPENQHLIKALGERVLSVSPRQLRRLEPLVLVDVQPPYFGNALREVAAVIDHHPPSGPYRARYRDVRTSYGASATMTAEYLLAEGDGALTRPLATALLYGIITDTKSLSRSASEDDLRMFAYLFPRADHALLRRIQHPSYSPVALKRFGQALQRARVRDGLAYAHLGKLPLDQEHIVAQLADFCLGMAGAEVSAVSGVFGARLVMSTRALSPDAQLGERLRDRFSAYGSAGGHPVMAKVVLRLSKWRKDHPYRDDRELERGVLAALREALQAKRRRRRTGGTDARNWSTSAYEAVATAEGE
jgi:nanoRNase/pAp phosphatase (c-di-AMP/oligoRNAs hydrolase)